MSRAMFQQQLDGTMKQITYNCYNVQDSTQEKDDQPNKKSCIIVTATSGKPYEVVENIKAGDLAMIDRDMTIIMACRDLFPFRLGTYQTADRAISRRNRLKSISCFN